jgi:putative ATP-binding cassette transporter
MSEISTTDSAPPLAQQVLTFAEALYHSRGRYKLVILAVGLALVIVATTFAQLRLNAWNGPFFDAIENKDLLTFGAQLAVFLLLATVLVVLNVGQTWLDQGMKIVLREQVSRDLLAQWLAPKRAFLLAGAGPIGSHPDQRIQEDARRLTELTASLGIGFFQSTLLLSTFVGVLWLLSKGFVLHLAGDSYQIPGFMVWSALIYATSGSWLSWRLGRPLIDLNAARYAHEADFRFGLMRANDSSDGIALYGGESDEERHLDSELDRVLDLARQIANAVARLTFVTAGYGWLAIIAPIVAAAPGYFGGQLTFGELMMSVGAFNQVQQALRWFVDNASNIADWRATLLRVMGLRQALLSLDRSKQSEPHIAIFEDAPALSIDDLVVDTAQRAIMLEDRHIEIKPGERVLIIGKPGEGKSMFFRALAGLWSAGTGRLRLPSRRNTIFLPQKSFIPNGSLRNALSYPKDSSSFAEADFIRALERTNLKHLVPLLDHNIRWEKELSADEQQHLSFARLLVHRPLWVISDEALCHLNVDDRTMLFSLFEHELVNTSVVSVSSNEAQHSFYSRTLRLSSHPLETPADGEGATVGIAGVPS